MLRFGKDVRSAITYNANNRSSDDPLTKTSAKTLADDITNVLAHIYGDHSNCKSYFCKKGGSEEFSKFRSTTAGKELIECFGRLATRSPRLIFDVTSNYAESFMALAAKSISGKRINFAQRGAYGRRIQAAALAYNNGGFWLLSKINSDKPVRSHIWRQAKSYFSAKKDPRKRARTGPFGRCKTKNSTVEDTQNYGPEALQGRLTDEEIAIAVDKLVKDLHVSEQRQREKIQNETVGQTFNDEWKSQRRNRLTASNAGKIFKMSDCTSNRNILQHILYPKDLSHNDNILRGINLEPKAKSFYAAKNKIEVAECGLFISHEYGFLASSPDLAVGNNGIAEMKCTNCKPDQIPLRPDKFLIRDAEGSLKLNRKHNYFYQVVMQLHTADKDFCDFCVYYEDPESNSPYFFQERVWRNDETLAVWKCMKEKLVKFYLMDMAQEIVDPIFPTQNRFREPEYRVQAIDAAKEKRTKKIR